VEEADVRIGISVGPNLVFIRCCVRNSDTSAMELCIQWNMRWLVPI